MSKSYKDRMKDLDFSDIYLNRFNGNRKQRRDLAKKILQGKLKVEKRTKIKNPLAQEIKNE